MNRDLEIAKDALSTGGRVWALVIAIIVTIISVVLIIYGIVYSVKGVDTKYNETTGTVVRLSATDVGVSYTVEDVTFTPVVDSGELVVGSSIKVYYQDNNPVKFSLTKPTSKKDGHMYIIVGVVILLFFWLIYFLTTKSDAFSIFYFLFGFPLVPGV